MRNILLSLLIAISLITQAEASPYSLSISAPLITKDPEYLRGGRIDLSYQPESLSWTKNKLFFSVSYGHWWVTDFIHNHSLSIYTIAPVFRHYFIVLDTISPFVDLSIGASYISRLHFANRSLGMHLIFQDQISLGASFGQDKNLSLAISTLHYSNASLCSANAGITVPLVATVAYRF